MHSAGSRRAHRRTGLPAVRTRMPRKEGGKQGREGLIKERIEITGSDLT